MCLVKVFKNYTGGIMAEVAWYTPGQWCCESELQPIPIQHFSSIKRDIQQTRLTLNPTKTKVAPIETHTILANGCALGTITWKQGLNIVQGANGASLTSISPTGPGVFSAICVGDPTVVQDWVTVKIDPIADLVPIPAGPAYACAGQSLTLTATASLPVDASYTYKWYTIKPTEQAFFDENSSISNLFVTAPQIFNIVEAPTLNINGPGTYYVQLLNTNGFKSTIRSISILNALPPGIRAINTSPADIGGRVTLTTSDVAGATYSWTGPNAFTSNLRSPVLDPLAETHLGRYDLTLSLPGGCTFTDFTTVTAANCELYVESKDAAGTETITLARVSNAPGTYAPLTLKVLPFEGTMAYTAYNITWYYNGAPITGAKNQTYIAAKPGTYKVVLSLIANAATVCEASVHLNAIPCKTFTDLDCGTQVNVELPDIQAAGVTLAPGDKFTAGDYTVVVTEISSGDPSAYTGTGYIEMRLVAGIVAKRIGVDFSNLVVNDCYEMASGKLQTMYDPSWSNIVDVDATVKGALEVYNEASNKLNDLFSVFAGTCKEIIDIETEIDSLEISLASISNQSSQYTQTLVALNNLKNAVLALKTCSSCTGNARISATANDCNSIFRDCVLKKDIFDQIAILLTDVAGLASKGITVKDPIGGNQEIPAEAIPIIDASGKCIAFIYDEKVYQWQCCANLGYFEMGKAPSSLTSHIAIFEDIINRNTQPFSWALKRALIDAGRGFIDFGNDPITNNPIVGIIGLISQIPNISVDGTVEYLSKLKKDDAYYVSASVILGAIGSGGFTAAKIQNIYKRLKSLGAVASKVADLADLCFSKPINCGIIVHYETFVSKNLAYLQSAAGRLEIWKLGITSGNAGMRGNIIEAIYKFTKYKGAKDLNKIKNNFPGVDFDDVVSSARNLISLKTFHVAPNSLDKLKTALRLHANALADASLSDLTKKAGYDLTSHSRTLDFVIKKGEYDMTVVRQFARDIVLEEKFLKLKGFNIIISEF